MPCRCCSTRSRSKWEEADGRRLRGSCKRQLWLDERGASGDLGELENVDDVGDLAFIKKMEKGGERLAPWGDDEVAW